MGQIQKMKTLYYINYTLNDNNMGLFYFIWSITFGYT